jgi:hypothetical protein
MNRRNVTAVLAIGLLVSGAVAAHDAKLHKGNMITGEITSVGAGGFELKTKTGAVKVTYSSKTKFEHGGQTVDKSHLSKGAHAGVIGTKLPTGELVAKEVLLGIEAPKAKGASGKDSGHKH